MMVGVIAHKRKVEKNGSSTLLMITTWLLFPLDRKRLEDIHRTNIERQVNWNSFNINVAYNGVKNHYIENNAKSSNEYLWEKFRRNRS